MCQRSYHGLAYIKCFVLIWLAREACGDEDLIESCQRHIDELIFFPVLDVEIMTYIGAPYYGEKTYKFRESSASEEFNAKSLHCVRNQMNIIIVQFDLRGYAERLATVQASGSPTDGFRKRLAGSLTTLHAQHPLLWASWAHGSVSCLRAECSSLLANLPPPLMSSFASRILRSVVPFQNQDVAMAAHPPEDLPAPSLCRDIRVMAVSTENYYLWLKDGGLQLDTGRGGLDHCTNSLFPAIDVEARDLFRRLVCSWRGSSAIFSLVSMFAKFLPSHSVPRRLIVVDVGALFAGEGNEPYAPLVAQGFADIVAFEPDKDGCDTINALREKQRQMLCGNEMRCMPYVIGDGSMHRFYSNKFKWTSSMLRANRQIASKFVGLAEGFRVKNVSRVQTYRLDDLRIENVDLLKLDVQGMELAILQGAQDMLKRVLVVHAEVSFEPMYVGQPLFGDIDAFLRSHGFNFHRFLKSHKNPVRPLFFATQMWQDVVTQDLYQDALYIRDLWHPERLSDDEILRTALILHEAYDSRDIALHLLSTRFRNVSRTYLKDLIQSIDPVQAKKLEDALKTLDASGEFGPSA
eukprot:TRINITY_DN46705_c0_g1_i1.p1 TRINITY_DN46705_c0_g1~~TRINITY_DN46705_c0_g1_i1.p1  ORF type:complete len:577 (-),score=40.82 TRINITY_DN46705_c0_g1_i1:204-1934(-)